MHRARFPNSAIVKHAEGGTEWILYFCYAPNGVLNSSQLYSLERLHFTSRKLAVVYASPRIEPLGSALISVADLVIWKALPGYDFSGYALGLDYLSRLGTSPSVFVMNDSVYGPLGDLQPLIARLSKWEIGGVSASGRFENHIQSYAFNIASLSPKTVRRLEPAMSLKYAYDSFPAVVLLQETLMARSLAEEYSVGSLWYAPEGSGIDISLNYAIELFADGVPFLKKSLFGKHRALGDSELLSQILAAQGHPVA